MLEPNLAVWNTLTVLPILALFLTLKLEPMEVPAAKREFPSDHAAVIVDLRWMRGE